MPNALLPCHTRRMCHHFMLGGEPMTFKLAPSLTPDTMAHMNGMLLVTSPQTAARRL